MNKNIITYYEFNNWGKIYAIFPKWADDIAYLKEM